MPGGALHLPAGALHGSDDSLGFLDRQRLGVACFFSAMPADPQHPRTCPFPHRGQRFLHAQARWHRATPAGTPSCSGRPLTSRFGVRAAPGFARGQGLPKLVAGTPYNAAVRRQEPMVDSEDPIGHALELARSATPAMARRRTALAVVARPAAEVAAAGGGRGQPAGLGGRARPGTIAGGLAGREAPACLGWRRGNHSAGDGGAAR